MASGEMGLLYAQVQYMAQSGDELEDILDTVREAWYEGNADYLADESNA